MTLSAMLMLRHLGKKTHADRLERAVARVLASGEVVPADLAGGREPAGTDQIADAIVAALD
jgi:isocitrate dehydrogenase (NAD+)